MPVQVNNSIKKFSGYSGEFLWNWLNYRTISRQLSIQCFRRTLFTILDNWTSHDHAEWTDAFQET